MVDIRQTPAGPLIAIAHWAKYQYKAPTAREKKHRRAHAQGHATADVGDERNDMDGQDDADARAMKQSPATLFPLDEAMPRNAFATPLPLDQAMPCNAFATPDTDSETDSEADTESPVVSE